MSLCLKSVFNKKEEQVQTRGPFFKCHRIMGGGGKKPKVYILVVFKTKTFVILLLILTL